MSSFGEELYELVQRMDKNERRYFKLFSKNLGGKESQIIQLFDALARQKVYNELKLKHKFRGQKIGQHLAIVKQRLYEVITKCLRNYHDNKHIEVEILERLKNVDILTKKRLYTLVIKELDRLEEIAKTHEQVLYLPAIFKLQLYVISVLSHPDDGQFLAKLRELSDAIDRLQMFFPYWETMAKHHYFNRHQVSDFSSALKELADKVDETDSNRLKEMVYLSLGNYYTTENKWQEALHCWQKGIQVIEQKAYHKSHVSSHNYILTLLNAIDCCTHIPLVKEFEAYCYKFDHVNTQGVTTEKMRSYRYFYINLNLRFYRKTGAIELGKIWSTKFKTITEQYPFLLSDLHGTILAYFEIANVYILAKEYELALDYLQKSLELLKNNKTKIEFQQMIRLLELIIYYHLESYVLLPNLIRSYDRQLDKKASYYPLAHQFGLLLKKLIDATDKLTKRELLLSTKTLLLNMNNIDDYLIYFPFLDWIESELEGQALEILLQNKYVQ